MPEPKPPIPITGAWLRKRGSSAEMLVEISGEWHLLASAEADGTFSLISEPGGMKRAPLDPMPALDEPARKVGR